MDIRQIRKRWIENSSGTKCVGSVINWMLMARKKLKKDRTGESERGTKNRENHSVFMRRRIKTALPIT